MLRLKRGTTRRRIAGRRKQQGEAKWSTRGERLQADFADPKIEKALDPNGQGLILREIGSMTNIPQSLYPISQNDIPKAWVKVMKRFL
ncbi:hypothetical protein [Paenibacillus agricola]|uniref:hypothetical protein n=1 Tax=Paenibacillus agricola TaxID=2716264 RepID=UPI001A9D4E58|nr:hypothetical protein [Paenibacillus agricola]